MHGEALDVEDAGSLPGRSRTFANAPARHASPRVCRDGGEAVESEGDPLLVVQSDRQSEGQ